MGPSISDFDSEKGVVEPCNYYVHVQQELCDKRQVVKDFCFTNGVKVQPINTVEELSEILYSKNEQQHTHFAFTLNSHEDGEMTTEPFEASSGLNCLCVKFTDILHTGQMIPNNATINKIIRSRTLYRTKRVYCFMFRSTEFQLYYDLALALMHKNREDRAEHELLQPDGEDQVQIIKTLKAHLASQ